MNKSILEKLEYLQNRMIEIESLLSDVGTISDQKEFVKLSQEYAKNEPIISCFKKYQKAIQAINDNEQELEDETGQMAQLIMDDIDLNKQQAEKLSQQLEVLLLPRDDRDDSNIFLEIRAGTGGDEAAIFAGDLFKMYNKFAEYKKWSVQIMNTNEADQGGFKEIVAKISGTSVFANLKFESGTHRVQRVPDTESQGRVHTSAATVAILPEADNIEEIDIKSADLKVDTFRASGAGGQHVNKTDSAIRLTHIPTGVVVECQDQRSQHKNKARAMGLLQAKLLEQEQTAADKIRDDNRKSQVGTGDRSERIRTYNYPQGRITDHRINMTLYKLDEIIKGDLSQLIIPLQQEHQAQLLLDG
ncbi:MAG: peptide chain release factor 1 [Gammaproteobacteria bacterium]|nr:MAG: peptide chain release factor 1 [Gammaproteobacteria bacterium]